MNKLGFLSFLMVIASISSFLIIRGPNANLMMAIIIIRDTFAIGHCICGTIKEVVVRNIGCFIKWRSLGFCIFPSAS